MDKEQHIRDTAYAIWLAEGRPEGRADQHWMQAEAQLEHAINGQERESGGKPVAEKTVTTTRTTRKTSKSANGG